MNAEPERISKEEFGASREWCIASENLLGLWVCTPLDLTAEEKTEMLRTLKQRRFMMSDIPAELLVERPTLAKTVDEIRQVFAICLDWVEDRMFGGFACGDFEHRRHIYWALGQYTYLGENGPLDSAERKKEWFDLMHHNERWKQPGDGPFTEDRPSWKEFENEYAGDGSEGFDQ